ncbi:hypothetical protein [Aliamphritea ceti]|uniref:hypothetical protein n=1 Tax=Aliamphritea ceti TaxID=1524258 RepID=UPI0021C3865D|nr:hypothetical protein [Aliamphritea ceti]
MANLYSKIHRLKAQGWTWDEFLQQISLIYPPGIDEKTLYGLYRHPHRKASRHIRQILEQLHDQCFPSPFPSSAEALIGLYNRQVNNPKQPDLTADQMALSAYLTEACQYGPLLYRARLYWLSANIQLDQLSVFRKNGKHEQLNLAQQQGIKDYQQSLSLLEEAILTTKTGASIDVFTLYKLRQNMLACYLNALSPEQRSESKTLLEYLKVCDFINSTKQVLESEPYQWLLARNGLRFSSLTQNAQDCQWFYRALCTANKAFKNLNYSPENTPSIASSVEFHWAIENALDLSDF